MPTNPKVEVEITGKATGFAAEFQKISAGAQQAASKVKASFSDLSSIGATLTAGLAAVSFGAFFKNASDAAESLQDLSDATGSSVESLSRLNNIVRVGGGSFDEIRGALERLAAGMAGAEEGTSKTAQALQFLKIKATDPALALEEIAKKLNTFADGAGKAAIARDLFGKSGVGFLASLKDIAEKGDVMATVTGRQAAETSKLAEDYRRLRIESTNLTNALYDGLVPALAKVTTRMAEASRLSGGVFGGLKLLTDAPPWEDAAAGIERLKGRIAELQDELKKQPKEFLGLKFGGPDVSNLTANLERARKALALLEDERIRAFGGAPTNERLGGKPPLPYTSNKPEATKKEVDEFARAVERVSKMAAEADLELSAMFSTQEITSAQKALAALTSSDEWKKFSGPQQQDLTGRFAAIDAVQRETMEWKKKREEQEKEIKVLQEHEQVQQQLVRAFDASLGSYAEQNNVLEQQIQLVGQDDLAHQKLAETLEFQRLRNQALLADDQSGLARLEEQFRRRIALTEELSEATQRFAEIQQYNQVFADAFGDALLSIVDGTKSLKDAFRDLERTIVRGLANIAINNLKKALFGGDSGGFDIVGLIGKLIGIFSGGGMSAGSGQYSNGLAGYAMGGDPPVGRLALVGERGPELIMPRAPVTVVPLNGRSAGGGREVHISQTINVLPGATTQSARQAASVMREAVIRSIKDR